MGKTFEVVVASDDADLLDFICETCNSAGLSTAACRTASECIGSFELSQPRLLCVDGRLEAKQNWPLFREIILRKDMRSVPMILVVPPGQKFECSFPADQCVYTMVADARLAKRFAPVLEELTCVQVDASRPPHFGGGSNERPVRRS